MNFEVIGQAVENAKIKVVGVGGAGGNAVIHMINHNIEGVDFICANTDTQALSMADGAITLKLGNGLTKGLGAGANPDVGRKAAESDRAAIEELLVGADMIFITAGMGGGTGTGAAPVVASIAKDLGALTVAVVTKPFKFEGKKRMTAAEKGLAALVEEDITNFATKDGTTFTGDVTVGANTAGHDVKFFGNSDGHYMLWDQSADELVLTSDSKLSFHDAAGGENIVASADGHLEVNAGTTLDLTAPTIDLNASTVVNVDGKTTLKEQADILTLQDSGATGQSGYVAFKDSGGTRLGYIGYPSNDDIYIKNEDADGNIFIWAASGQAIKNIGNVAVGSDGSGHDVTFNSDTAGDNMVWSSSAEKLTITGTDGQDALHVAAGNVNFDGDLDVSGTTNFDGIVLAGNMSMTGDVFGANPIVKVAYKAASGSADVASDHRNNPVIYICNTDPASGSDSGTLTNGDIWINL